MSFVDAPYNTFLALTRTNLPPNPSEVVEIRQLMFDKQETIDAIRIALEKARAELADVQRVYDVKKAKRDAIKGILSPFRRLPAEVLASIFLASMEDRKYADPEPTMQLPMTLCAISSRLRKIALDTPGLWNRMCINTKYLRMENLSSLLDMWFTRAKSLPMKLLVKSCPDDTPAHNPVKLLVSRSRRIEELELEAPAELAVAFLNMPPGKLNALKTFTWESQETMLPMSKIRAFKGAPRLTSFAISAPIDASILRLPWSKLRSLELRGEQTAKECVHFLKVCTALDVAVLKVRPPTDDEDERGGTPMEELTHSTLTLLELDLLGDTEAAFLDFLVLPALKDLDVYASTLNARYEAGRLVERSKCELATFKINGEDVNAPHAPALVEGYGLGEEGDAGGSTASPGAQPVAFIEEVVEEEPEPEVHDEERLSSLEEILALHRT